MNWSEIKQWFKRLWTDIPCDTRTVFCGCLAVILGISLTLGAEEWYIGTKPVPLHVVRLDVRPVPNTKGARWLDVYLVGPPSKKCLRFSQHLIYRDILINFVPTRNYYPLGSALNGENFTSSNKEIEISMRLPYGLEQGDWWYVDRSVYTCIIWPGLIKQTLLETTPTKVVINDNLTADSIHNE